MKSDKSRVGIYLAVLFLVCLMVYWPQKGCGFILDGHFVVGQNASIKSPALYGEILRQGFFDAFKSQWDFRNAGNAGDSHQLVTVTSL